MTNPVIIAIDDAEEDLVPLIPEGIVVQVINPGDRDLPKRLRDMIGGSSLILLDQKFFENPEPLALNAADGASFVGHLRSWSRQEAKALPPLVLLTNDDEAFVHEIPAIGAAVQLNGSFIGKEFRIAPALDVEWVQHKAQDNTTARVAELVSAFDRAQQAAGEDGVSLEDLENFLGLASEREWWGSAREELRRARPPISQKDEGLLEPCGPSQVVRWMCHRALPFPGMLFSDLYAAWALGLSSDAFTKIVNAAAENPETPWLTSLHEAKYSGPLNTFLGRRWWKSGIDYLAWKLDQETSKENGRDRAFRTFAPTVEIGALRPTSSHVVTWSPDLVEAEVSSIEDSVQLRVPGWPAEALDPWMLKSNLENDAVLQSMVEPADFS